MPPRCPARARGVAALVSEPHRRTPGDKPAPKAVVGRVSLYLRQLEACARRNQETISSSQLGAALGIGDAQVRKDLAFFGQFGYPGIGYRIEELSVALRRILGIDRIWPTAMIGLGNLGRALIKYRGFRSRGFHIVALFDNDPKKIGTTTGGLTVRALDDLARATAELGIELAILSVPADDRLGGGLVTGRPAMGFRHEGGDSTGPAGQEEAASMASLNTHAL